MIQSNLQINTKLSICQHVTHLPMAVFAFPNLIFITVTFTVLNRRIYTSPHLASCLFLQALPGTAYFPILKFVSYRCLLTHLLLFPGISFCKNSWSLPSRWFIKEWRLSVDWRFLYCLLSYKSWYFFFSSFAFLPQISVKRVDNYTQPNLISFIIAKHLLCLISLCTITGTYYIY